MSVCVSVCECCGLFVAVEGFDLREGESFAVLEVGGEGFEAVVAVGDGGHGGLEEGCSWREGGREEREGGVYRLSGFWTHGARSVSQAQPRYPGGINDYADIYRLQKRQDRGQGGNRVFCLFLEYWTRLACERWS